MLTHFSTSERVKTFLESQFAFESELSFHSVVREFHSWCWLKWLEDDDEKIDNLEIESYSVSPHLRSKNNLQRS